MRIRKRWPPLPSQHPPVSSVGASSKSSALHPTSSEDTTRRPLLWAAPNHQYVPQQEENRHRPDLQLTIAGEMDGDEGKHEGKRKKQTEGVDCMHRSHKQEERIEEETAAAVAEEKRFASSSSNLRNESNMNGAAPSGLNLVQPSSSSHQVPARRWCEEERAVPLKKRKGNSEGKANHVTIMEKEKKMKPNKKRVGEEDDGIGCNGVKKRGRGGDGVVMEGSRCSRVNGRGWRCCQQTLVGYSLCEHHLGKGRLRSMSSVRSRATSPSPTIEPENNKVEPGLSLSSTSLQVQKALEEANEQADEDDDEKPLKAANKRKKIGMVKARSISSLLGQSLHEPTVTPINNLLKL